MIRRLLDFTFILLFVWACMLIGLWFIDSFIVPFEFPGITSDLLTSIFKVTISSVLVLSWLWLWREIVRRIFWRAIRKQQYFKTNTVITSQEKRKKSNHSEERDEL